MTTIGSGPDSLDYAALVQDALRSVARRALEQAAAYGLPGTHHFYLTFRTQGSGVEMSRSLLDQYPVEMTVVLQHEFRDLEVDAEAFAVTLRFNGVPHRLLVPFSALTAFYDPSAQFLLRFDGELGDGAMDESALDEAPPRRTGPVAVPAERMPRDAARADSRQEDDAEDLGADDEAWDEARWSDAAADDRTSRAESGSADDGPADDDSADDGTPESASAGDAEPRPADESDETAEPSESKPDEDRGNVVSIDRFRRDR